MSGFSPRLWMYRRFQGWVERWILPRWMSSSRVAEGRANLAALGALSASKEGKQRAWFHAASVGELESLTPVIAKWVEQGGEAAVTVLSESARGSVERLKMSLSARPDGLIFAGYAPWEGHWRELLEKVQPSVFLTAKYEAWPELWVALGELGIPLLIVSAKGRRSLRVASVICRVLGGRLPFMKLLTVLEEDAPGLRRIFGESGGVQVVQTGEPRWDRVQERAKTGSPRARALIEKYRNLPRPWGVLGSVWPEDMELWRGRFAKGAGTLWVVPHRVDAKSVEGIQRYLTQAGLRVVRTSEATELEGAPNCVLVDELGFLLELYADTDWAYVGGGFGISMHSTIEPAIFGIPVACGPNGAERFSEIAELAATGQLTLIKHADDLDAWLVTQERRAQNVPLRDQERMRWREQAKARLGATDRIIEIMRKS